MQILYALWLRQIKRYFRSRSRIVGSLGQPFLFLIALGFGLGPIFEKAEGGSYIEFLSPGIIAMSILFPAVFSGIEIIWDKQFGFLKEMLVAPVPRFEIMIGRTLGGATVSTIQGAVMLAICLTLGFDLISPVSVMIAFVFMFMIALLFTALGTAIASVLDDMQGFQLIMNFLLMPLFFLSGALFPLKDLPKGIEFISRVNPLSYGVDALRGALTGTFHFGPVTDFLFLFVMIILCLGAGTYFFKRIQI